MTAHISIFEGRQDWQFAGASAQDRVAAELTASWPETAQATVESVFGVAAVVLDVAAVVYAGGSGDEADWEARGVVYPAGRWTFGVVMGDGIAIRAIS